MPKIDFRIIPKGMKEIIIIIIIVINLPESEKTFKSIQINIVPSGECFSRSFDNIKNDIFICES